MGKIISDIPMYQQISSRIKEMIICGELSEGDLLPSMRTLAAEQHMSVITTKRAYEELVREGYIESYTGKGSFVKKQNIELIRKENLCLMEELLQQACLKARICGVELEEMKEKLVMIYGSLDRE